MDVGVVMEVQGRRGIPPIPRALGDDEVSEARYMLFQESFGRFDSYRRYRADRKGGKTTGVREQDVNNTINIQGPEREREGKASRRRQ